MAKYDRFYIGEWSILYKDGVKVVEGDHYHTDDYLAWELGVQDHHDDRSIMIDNRNAYDTLYQWQGAVQTKRAKEREEKIIEINKMIDDLCEERKKLFDKIMEG